jgi:hypothetical protein
MFVDLPYLCKNNHFNSLSNLFKSFVFGRLTHSESHSELTTQLIKTYLELRTFSQSIITESLHYAQITEETNALLLKHLQTAVEHLRVTSNISPNRVHILILRDTNIVAIYSGYV